MKVAVCLSSNGMVHAAFTSSLVAMLACATEDSVLLNAESALNFINREGATGAARSIGCSHVLFLDSDMTFPPHTIDRLLDADRDIVGCRYPRRVAPFAVLGRMLGARDGDYQEAIELPSGCLMIRTSVFDKLRAPYFRCPAIEHVGYTTPELEGFDLTGYEAPTCMSEDYYFCQAARRAGFKVWADNALSLEIGHIGMVTHQIPGGANGQ